MFTSSKLEARSSKLEARSQQRWVTTLTMSYLNHGCRWASLLRGTRLRTASFARGQEAGSCFAIPLVNADLVIAAQNHHHPRQCRTDRCLSSRGRGWGGNDDDEKNLSIPDFDFEGSRVSPSIDEISSDPFGVHFEDGKEGLGPVLPPLYQRDTTTGRFTGEVIIELSDNEKRLLAADSLEQDAMLLDSVEKHWTKSPTDKATGLPTALNRLGARIRSTEMATNVLGRSVKAQASSEQLDTGEEMGRDETRFSQHLTKSEFKTFSNFMKNKHQFEVSEEDIPVHENKSSKSRKATAVGEDPENTSWSLQWLSARAQRQMDDSLDDNPYSDLMPGDLSPNRVVNRKRAKQIPVALLHHNNMSLLQNFITPTGQIRNRVQTRLGARDQRRVARLIKRSRALGLVPFLGQFKAEQHGWVNAPDIHEDRSWEKTLAQRGLVIKDQLPTNVSKSDSDKSEEKV